MSRRRRKPRIWTDEDIERKHRREIYGNSGSNRRFSEPNGAVDDQPANVTRKGDRTVAYFGEDNVGKVVSNDGMNASYLRNEDGRVVVNDATEQPYDSTWEPH